jgi:DNA-binding PadR family transcriptional regulator
VLKDAGLVTGSKSGTRRLYQLDPAGVERMRAHFDRMWTNALEKFQAAAEKQPSGGPHGQRRNRKRRS